MRKGLIFIIVGIFIVAAIISLFYLDSISRKPRCEELDISHCTLTKSDVGPNIGVAEHVLGEDIESYQCNNKTEIYKKEDKFYECWFGVKG